MVTVEQAATLLELQEETNAIARGRAWRSDSDIVWSSAVIAETAELLDSIAYKWWKQQDTDFDNAWVECVDLLHFLLSACLQKGLNAQDVYEALNTPQRYDITKREAMHVCGNMVANVVANDPARAIMNLVCIAHYLDHTAEELVNDYLIKNALNNFRQANGYKEGTYCKTWTISNHTAEDNWFVFAFCRQYETYNDIYDAIGVLYERANSNSSTSV